MLEPLLHPRRCIFLVVATIMLLYRFEVFDKTISPSLRRRLNLLRSDSGEQVWFLERLHTPAQQATLDALGNATSVSNSSFDASGTTAQWRCPDGRLLEDPTVIVGTDGSGTRVVAKLLSLLNVTVLVEREVYHQMDVDGVAAGVHFTKTIQHVLAAASADAASSSKATQSSTTSMETSVAPPPSSSSKVGAADAEARNLIRIFAASQRANACAALSAASRSAAMLEAGAPSGAWAFKKPDLMNLLPYLAEVFPQMQVLHVVRDGRDMAYSHNRAPISKYAPHLNLKLPQPPPPPSDPEISCAAWAHQNLEALRWGESWSKKHSHHHRHDLSGEGSLGTGSVGSLRGGNGPSSSSPSALARSLIGKDEEDEVVVEHYRWRRIEDFNASDARGLALWVSAVMEVQGGPRGGTSLEEATSIVQKHMLDLNGKSLGSHDPSVRAANKLARAESSSSATTTTVTTATTNSASKPPSVGGYGKWRTLADFAMQKRLEAIAQEALKQFGYL